MREHKEKKLPKPKPKILPSLGGLKKNYIRKSSCLEKSLLFLAKKLADVEKFKGLETKERELVNKIKQNIKMLSEYKKLKTYDYYTLCLYIINNY